MRKGLEAKAHLIVLATGLANVAVLPLWQLPVAKEVAQGLGYPLFGVGLVLNVLSVLALKGGIGGEVVPVTDLVTSGIYAWLRHPMYTGFAMTMLGLDTLLGSASGTLTTFFAFLPSMVWRARLEERALARHFGQTWESYAERVPSLLLWDCRTRKNFLTRRR